MRDKYVIQSLKKNRRVFKSLLSGIPKEMYVWKPSPDKWCLLEIICHLHDEEREDFRTRTRQVLENPEIPPPPIDPVAWVKDRAYMEQDFANVLKSFLEERKKSIKWLKSLESPQWDNAYPHPKRGPLTAGMFLANWLAHDYLHIRQINQLKYGYLQQISGEDLSYAGNW